jgi:hypothetical protein
MSRFNETVAKIAACPTKRSLFSAIPGELFAKEAAGAAGAAAAVGGSLLRDIGKGVGTAVIGGAMLGAGAFAFDKLKNSLLGNQDEERERHKELGKLTAQGTFKAQALLQLTPVHETTFKTIMSDDVIKDADPGLMKSTYTTMKNFAPNLAADTNAARSFLREHAVYGTGPSYAALKNLADAEQAIARAGGASIMPSGGR